MDSVVDIAGNLFSVVAFGCAIVGFLLIWKQISGVHEASHQAKRTNKYYEDNPTVERPPLRVARDYDAETAELKYRLHVAEVDAENAANDAADALSQAEYKAELAANLVEEAKEAAKWAAECAADEMGSRLADAVDEAERHWAAGLNETERLAAWANHWRDLEKPVRDVIEEQARWMAEAKAKARRQAANSD